MAEPEGPYDDLLVACVTAAQSKLHIDAAVQARCGQCQKVYTFNVSDGSQAWELSRLYASDDRKFINPICPKCYAVIRQWRAAA